jgi:glutamate racemase
MVSPIAKISCCGTSSQAIAPQGIKSFSQTLSHASNPGSNGGAGGTNSTNDSPPPPITVNSQVDQAVQQLLAAAQAKLNSDQAAWTSTQNQITSLENDIDDHGPTPKKVKRLQALQTQLAQQQQQIYNDQAEIDTCTSFLYGDQASADWQTEDAAYNDLINQLAGSGIDLQEGDTLSDAQQAKLTPAQQKAYTAYTNALGVVQADNAASYAAYTDLQNMVSSPNTYGPATSDAIDAVNNVIEPLGYYVNAPDAIDPTTAQQNANYWNAASNYANAIATYDNASTQVDSDEQQLKAYRRSMGHLAYDDTLGQQLQTDKATQAQAYANAQNAQSKFYGAQGQVTDQLRPGLQKELGIQIAQEYYNDAQGYLAEVQKMPPAERRRYLADAQEWVQEAQAQLTAAKNGDWQAVTQFSDQDLQTAINNVMANHAGETVGDVSVPDLVNGLGWEFKVNHEMGLIQSAPDTYLTPFEKSLLTGDNQYGITLDLPTLALIKAAGGTIDPNNPYEITLAQQDPAALASMILGKVGFTEVNNQIVVTINGQEVPLDAAQGLAPAVANKNPDTIMRALMSGNLIPFSDDNNNLIAGTQYARLDYVKSQMQQYMGGKNPTVQQQQQAMNILTLNMNGAFSLQERELIWQEAGLPYFNKNFLLSQFQQIINNKNTNNYDDKSSGRASDKIGEYLIGLLQNAHASPEVAEVILGSIKDSYNAGWITTYVSGGRSSQDGVNFYQALSMAVQFADQLDPTTASAWAQWLTAPGEGGLSILQDLGGAPNFYYAHNAVMGGYNDLSDAINGLLRNSNSYFAQGWTTNYIYDVQDAQNAQAYETAYNSYSNFSPQKDVPAYFNQFNGNKYINKPFQAKNDTQLEDVIGEALGLPATDPQALANQDTTTDWYAKGSEQRNIIDLIIGWIHQEGGANPTITVMPMVYAAQDGGVQYGALIQVRTGHGQSVLIDGTVAEQAVTANKGNAVSPNTSIGAQWHYKNLQDYEDNNPLSRDGTIYLPNLSFLPASNTGGNNPNYRSYHAHNLTWKDFYNAGQDAVCIGLAIGLTVITGGLGAPIALAILIGGTAGFVAFEASAAAENAISLNQGDQLNGQQVSLITVLKNNWGHGGVTSQEIGQAWTDAAMDAVTSYTAAAGAAYGQAATVSFKEAFTQSLLNAGWKPWMIRLVAGAQGMVASQAWMGAGNVISTGINVNYLLSQGLITQDQAAQMLCSAFYSALFNLAIAPVTGAAGGLLPEGVPGQITVSQVLGQAGVNLGINALMTEVPALFTGGWEGVKKNFGQDAVSILVNTAFGMGMHLAGSRSAPATLGSAEPGSVTVDPAKLEATMRGTFNIPETAPSFLENIQVLSDSEFAEAFTAFGGEGDPSAFPGFRVTLNGNDLYFIRESAIDLPALTNKLAGAYMNPTFQALASNMRFDDGVSVLDAVMEYLTSDPAPGAQNGAEVKQVADIFSRMQQWVDPYAAVFQNDPAARGLFTRLAMEAGIGFIPEQPVFAGDRQGNMAPRVIVDSYIVSATLPEDDPAAFNWDEQQNGPLQAPASQNDYSYDPETGIVTAAVDGGQVTLRVRGQRPQQLSASDIALPGGVLDGKSFAIYRDDNGGYRIKPIVQLTVDGEPVSAIWIGPNTLPSAAKLQAGYDGGYLTVFKASEGRPARIMPRMAGGAQRPGEPGWEDASPTPPANNRPAAAPLDDPLSPAGEAALRARIGAAEIEFREQLRTPGEGDYLDRLLGYLGRLPDYYDDVNGTSYGRTIPLPSPMDAAGLAFPMRGVLAMQTRNGVDIAAAALGDPKIRRVMLVTGFTVAEGVPETDGPPGTAVLARALERAGKKVTVVTNSSNKEVMTAALKAVGAKAKLADFNAQPDAIATDPISAFVNSLNSEERDRARRILSEWGTWRSWGNGPKPGDELIPWQDRPGYKRNYAPSARNDHREYIDQSLKWALDEFDDSQRGQIGALLKKGPYSGSSASITASRILANHKPDAVIAIELPGRNAEGNYLDMDGVSVRDFNSPLDAFVLVANDRGITTIGIGDRANQAGMDNVNINMRLDVLNSNEPASNPKDVYSVVSVDYPITASVSNWGAILLGGAVLRDAGLLRLMPTANDYVAAVRAAGDAGAVDGFMGLKPGAKDSYGLEAFVDGLDERAHTGWYQYYLMPALEAPVTPIRYASYFDSSNGGLVAASTLARVIREKTGVPVTRFIALDHGQAPYGTRPKRTIRALTNAALDFLRAFKSSGTVIVCNTASASGYTEEQLIVDLVRPTAEFIAKTGGDHPVIVATPGTVRGHAYRDGVKDAAARLGLQVQPVVEIGAEYWAPAINRLDHISNDPKIIAKMDKSIADIARKIATKAPEATSVFMCCTHYPVLMERLAKELKKLRIDAPVIDPMINQADVVIGQLGLSKTGVNAGPDYSPPPVIVTTGDTVAVYKSAQALLERSDVYIVGVSYFSKLDPHLDRFARAPKPVQAGEAAIYKAELAEWQRLRSDPEWRRYYNSVLGEGVPFTRWAGGELVIDPYNDYFIGYGPETGIVTAAVDGGQVTLRIRGQPPQQLSASDIAMPGQSLNGKSFAIYQMDNGSYCIRPIVGLTVNGEPVSAVWIGPDTLPSAAALQAGYDAGYLHVFEASEGQPVRIMPKMAGGGFKPGELGGDDAPPTPPAYNPYVYYEEVDGMVHRRDIQHPSPMDAALGAVPIRLVHGMWVYDGVDVAAMALGDPNINKVMIVTGFTVAQGMPETDGPPGAGVLAHDLLVASKEVTIVTDSSNYNVINVVLKALGISNRVKVIPYNPQHNETGRQRVAALLGAEQPDFVLTMERPGPNADGNNLNMRSVSVGEYNPALYLINDLANARGIPTGAIGDGGNETGMGGANRHMPLNPLKLNSGTSPPSMYAVDGARYPITAFESNLGAAALGGAVLRNLDLLDQMHTADQFIAAVYAAGGAGAVDGVMRLKPGEMDSNGLQAFVDGLNQRAHEGWYQNYLMPALRKPVPQGINIVQAPQFVSAGEAQYHAAQLASLQSEMDDVDLRSYYNVMLGAGLPPADDGQPGRRGPLLSLSKAIPGWPWYAGMVGLTAPLSYVVNPVALGLGNATGFTLRGLATLAPFVFPKINGRVVAVLKLTGFVLNGASHDYSAQSFNLSHLNSPGQPYNTLYAGTDAIGGGQAANEAATGQPVKPSAVLKYIVPVAGTAANTFLMLGYSVPAGPLFWVPTLLFAGGTVYNLGKNVVGDITYRFNSARVQGNQGGQQAGAAGGSSRPQTRFDTKASNFATGAGLISFGIALLLSKLAQLRSSQKTGQKTAPMPTTTSTPPATPTQPPATNPLPPTSFPTSPPNHFPGNPNPAGYNAGANGANYVKVTPGESLWQIATNVVLNRNQIENIHPTPVQLNAQIGQEVQLIERANPQIVQNGGSGTYDLIWAGDEIDVPNIAQIPGIAPQAGAVPGWAINGNEPGTVLPAGTRLNLGDHYTSPNGEYELVMQYHGDLVLYRNNPNGTQTRVFETGTYEGNPYSLGVGDHAVIQSDGNLVVFRANNDGDKPGDVVWQSNTGSPADAYSVLVIQDDGNLVTYAKSGATWDAQGHNVNTRLAGDPVGRSS